MGLLRIMDATGDTVVEWSMDDPASVARAQAAFTHQLVRRHRVPFARGCGAPAAGARPVATFDPAAEEIVFAAPVAGG